MIQGGEMNLQDYVAIVNRRWPVIAVLAFFGCIAGFGIARALPKKYMSQTTVLVDPPRISETIVKQAVTEDLNHRLGSMKEQILSRTRLEPLVDKFALFTKDSNKLTKEDQIEKLRKAIDVSPMAPMQGTDDRRLPGFYVSITLDNPILAQQVCSEITKMFMEQNLQRRAQRAEETTEFLTTNLAEAKAKLDDQDAKLAEFKKHNMGSLPDETQTNLSLLTGLNTQLEATTQALGRSQTEKAYTESLLAQQEAAWKSSQAGTNPQTLEQQLNLMQDQLAALQARYTDEHPDVIKMKKSIEQMKQQIQTATKSGETAPKPTTKPGFEPPQLQQLRAQLHQSDITISGLTKRQESLQDQIRTIQGRIQMSPIVEQQFKELTRNHQVALDFYNDLLKQHDQAAMSEKLEQAQQSEQFHVLDSPNLPERPAFPDWRLFSAGGFAFGFLLGAVFSAMLEFQDKTLRTEREVEIFLKVPALAILPVFEPSGKKRGSLLDAFRPTPKVAKV